MESSYILVILAAIVFAVLFFLFGNNKHILGGGNKCSKEGYTCDGNTCKKCDN